MRSNTPPLATLLRRPLLQGWATLSPSSRGLDFGYGVDVTPPGTFIALPGLVPHAGAAHPTTARTPRWVSFFSMDEVRAS